MADLTANVVRQILTAETLGFGSSVIFNRLKDEFASAFNHQDHISPFTISIVSPYAQDVRVQKIVANRTPESLRGSSLLVNGAGLAVGLMPSNNTGTNDGRVDQAAGRNVSPSQFTKSDEEYIQNINRQVGQIKHFPALTLLVAPATISKSMEPTVEYSKGRRGPIVSQWLERPMVLQATGKTMAQMIVTKGGGGGLTNGFRSYSDSYKNLLALFSIYKNNGLLYTNSGVDGSSSKGVPIFPVAVQIEYSGTRYVGSFDSFNIKEAAETPFLMNYDFTFTVRAEYSDY